MEFEPLKLPPQNVPSATLSLLLSIITKLEVVESRISEMEKGNEPLSSQACNDLAQRLYDEYKTMILAKFGE
jgi:hypothetical protein